MVTVSANAPIEVAISNAYGAIQDDATADLRNVIKEIDTNSKKKEQLRQIQEQLVLAKAAARTGDKSKIDKAFSDLGKSLKAPTGVDTTLTDYDSTTSLGKAFNEQSGIKSNGQFKTSSDPASDTSKEYDAYFEALETQLKSEMDRHSDISSKLQVEMNTKSSILRRSEQAVSDNESAFQKTKDGIQRNYKG